MRFILMFSVCVGLAACQETTAVSSAPPSCGSEEMSHLMGIQRTQLENIAFSQPYRIIPEGLAVTMDFNPARVNFELDQNDAVARIYCG